MPDADPLAALKALADPVRLRLMAALPRTDCCDHVKNVTELAQELDLPQSTVSRHLGILRQAGLVRNERMCRDVYYWIDLTLLAATAKAVADLGQDPPACVEAVGEAGETASI